jgi:Flp pilus assembly protein TadG
MSAFDSLHGTEAAALLEFAVSLPFLVVLVVGIFDFGGAFNLKQELNNAAREGARFGSTQPTNDLLFASATPGEVDAVRRVVDSYLINAHINDCGLSALTGGTTGGGFSWNYSAKTGCAGQTLLLTIDRGAAVPETLNGNPVNVVCTTVTINYPYQWHFNNVISLLIPGAHLNLLTIQTQATAVNTD